MSSITEFFHMGGYAFYVWSSYALTGVCLTAIVVWSSMQHRKIRRQAIRRAQQAAKRRN